MPPEEEQAECDLVRHSHLADCRQPSSRDVNRRSSAGSELMAASRSQVRGITRSVVTCREGSHSLVARLLLVRGLAAQLALVLCCRRAHLGLRKDCTRRKCSAAVISIVVVICSASCLQSQARCATSLPLPLGIAAVRTPPLRAHTSQRCDDDEHHDCCCSAAPLHKPWSCAWPPPSARASSTKKLM